MPINIERRQFISAIGGAAVWPLAARAQQPKRMRRIGVLNGAADDPAGRALFGTFVQGLQDAGWVGGRNVEIETRSAAGDFDQFHKYASELVALEPVVILAATDAGRDGVAAGELHRADCVRGRFRSDRIWLCGRVFSAGREYHWIYHFRSNCRRQWLGLLKEIAPSIKHVSMLFNPETANAGASGGIYLSSIEAAAHVQNIELIVGPVHNPADIDYVLAAIAQSPDGGLIVMPNAFTDANWERIVALAARFRIPTVYPSVIFVKGGGLLCYASDVTDMFRRAASYVVRILKGEKPANLPVQEPIKFELAVNLSEDAQRCADDAAYHR